MLGILILGITTVQENQIPFTKAGIVGCADQSGDAILKMSYMQPFNSPAPSNAFLQWM